MSKEILNKTDIEKIIFRLSIEILERNSDPSNLIVLGIKRRGDILAKKICEKIRALENIEVKNSAIDITFYRDDVQLKAYKYVGKDEIPYDITGKDVVLADDVIHTGRSVRAAMDALLDMGRPKSIQLAVLVARGGREFPIQPDYVGKRIDDYIDDKVDVNFTEIDGEDKVIIKS